MSVYGEIDETKYCAHPGCNYMEPTHEDGLLGHPFKRPTPRLTVVGPETPPQAVQEAVEEPAEDEDPDAIPTGPKPHTGIIPPPTNPMAVARVLLPAWQYQRMPALYHWKGSWMRWVGPHWEEVDEAQMRSTLYRAVERATYVETTARGEDRAYEWAPSRRKIADLLEAVEAITHLKSTVEEPSFLPMSRGEQGPEQGVSRVEADAKPQVGGVEQGEQGESGKNSYARMEGTLVSCANGLLDIVTRELHPHTPIFFNRVSVPFAYDPTAPEPKKWLDFLHRLFPDDPEAIEVLQEYFGYVLSGRTDLHKMLLIVGPMRSGKGTLARILTAMVGEDNTAAPTLAGLAESFGMADLIGKTLAVVGDARFTKATNTTVVERLLSISAADPLEVNRKYQKPWKGKIPARLVILSNDLPSFTDASGAIASRMLILTLTKSWLGKEQLDLTDQLMEELPGILNWSLDGLEKLTARGRITEPSSSEEARDIVTRSVSPIKAFLADLCEVGPDLHVSKDKLFNAWTNWCLNQNQKEVGDKAAFSKELFAAEPTIASRRPRGTDGKQYPVYVGIGLRSPM